MKHLKQRLFRPEQYEKELIPLIEELIGLPSLDELLLRAILKKHSKEGGRLFSKKEIIHGYRHFAHARGWSDRDFVRRIRMRPVRTSSGIVAVTVLTKPYPCPGKCVFCPNDAGMPKSYLLEEQGAQRALHYDFDPYQQTLSRLRSFHDYGHCIEKTELIVLGGSWLSYPEKYQRWFVVRCLDAINDFREEYSENEVDFILSNHATHESEIENDILLNTQRANEQAEARCVGLSFEIRPDQVTEFSSLEMRRLGATKIQIGFQSLSDEILAANNRGHSTDTIRKAMSVLRSAGFKVHAHWMPNLVGSSPEKDIEDFARLFNDKDFRPDELKIYPCCLVETAELMNIYRSGNWAPYSSDELMYVLRKCMEIVPQYCRLTRVIRDIPASEILAGNKRMNLRQLVEASMDEQEIVRNDIRSREIKEESIDWDELQLEEIEYKTSIGEEIFLQYIGDSKKIAAFLRLSLPCRESFIDEIRYQALIREVHVYGNAASIGSRSSNAQHLGLGKKLIARARELSRERGFSKVAVISAIGTREYYRGIGFEDGSLYQHISTSRHAHKGSSE